MSMNDLDAQLAIFEMIRARHFEATLSMYVCRLTYLECLQLCWWWWGEHRQIQVLRSELTDKAKVILRVAQVNDRGRCYSSVEVPGDTNKCSVLEWRQWCYCLCVCVCVLCSSMRMWRMRQRWGIQECEQSSRVHSGSAGASDCPLVRRSSS